MIGEWSVHAGDLGGRHVAGDAAFYAYGARFARVVKRGFDVARDVAGEAFGVVGGSVAHDGLVRIMAGDAFEPCVAIAPAAASFKTIGLKAHIAHASGACVQDVAPRAMASAAEIQGSDGAERGGVENRTAALLNFS